MCDILKHLQRLLEQMRDILEHFTILLEKTAVILENHDNLRFIRWL